MKCMSTVWASPKTVNVFISQQFVWQRSYSNGSPCSLSVQSLSRSAKWQLMKYWSRLPVGRPSISIILAMTSRDTCNMQYQTAHLNFLIWNSEVYRSRLGHDRQSGAANLSSAIATTEATVHSQLRSHLAWLVYRLGLAPARHHSRIYLGDGNGNWDEIQTVISHVTNRYFHSIKFKP